MADKVADKIAAMEAEQRRQGDSFKAWLGKLEEQSRAESKVEVSSKVRCSWVTHGRHNFGVPPAVLSTIGY